MSGRSARRLQVQTCCKQTLDHAVVQFAGDAVAVVENLESGRRLDELGGGLETLADVSHRGDGRGNLAQLAAERAERDLHRDLASTDDAMPSGATRFPSDEPCGSSVYPLRCAMCPRCRRAGMSVSIGWPTSSGDVHPTISSQCSFA